MNKKTRFLFRIGILCLGLLFILNNCEKSSVATDEVLNNLPQAIDKGFIITSTSFSAKDKT